MKFELPVWAKLVGLWAVSLFNEITAVLPTVILWGTATYTIFQALIAARKYFKRQE